MIIAVLGLLFVIAGVAAYAVVSSTLADEKITVSSVVLILLGWVLMRLSRQRVTP